MNIVITYNPNHPILSGLVPTLQVINTETVVWIPQHKPVYDMIEEVNPDIIFMDDKQITPSFISAIKENPNIKIVLFGLSFISQLNPSLVCLSNNIPEQIQENLKNNNIEYMSVSRAANIVQYRNGKKSPEYECDVFYWSTVPVNKEIFDVLCDLVQTDLRVKIGGPFRVLLPQYIGDLDIYDVSNFMVSAKFALTNTTSEIDYMANEVNVLIYPGSFTGSRDLIQSIQQWSNKNDEDMYGSQILYENKLHTINNRTYFHRLHDIFKKLKMDDLAQQSLDKLEDFV